MKKHDTLKKELNKLDKFVHKPNDFIEKMQEACASVEGRVNRNILELTRTLERNLLTKNEEIREIGVWKDMIS